MSSITFPGMTYSDARFGEKNSFGVGLLLVAPYLALPPLILDPAIAFIDPDFYFSGDVAPPYAICYLLSGMFVGGMEMVL